MSNYRRLISYIYAYEGGIKGKNIGFAKIETRGSQCKITVNVKKVYVGGNDIGVYLLAGEKEILLGNIFIRGGSGEFRTVVSVSDVEHSGIPMDQCYGLTVHDVENTWRSYTTIWEDAVAHAAEVELSNTLPETKEREETAQEAQIKKAIKEIEEEFPVENEQDTKESEKQDKMSREQLKAFTESAREQSKAFAESIRKQVEQSADTTEQTAEAWIRQQEARMEWSRAKASYIESVNEPAKPEMAPVEEPPRNVHGTEEPASEQEIPIREPVRQQQEPLTMAHTSELSYGKKDNSLRSYTVFSGVPAVEYASELMPDIETVTTLHTGMLEAEANNQPPFMEERQSAGESAEMLYNQEEKEIQSEFLEEIQGETICYRADASRPFAVRPESRMYPQQEADMGAPKSADENLTDFHASEHRQEQVDRYKTQNTDEITGIHLLADRGKIPGTESVGNTQNPEMPDKAMSVKAMPDTGMSDTAMSDTASGTQNSSDSGMEEFMQERPEMYLADDAQDCSETSASENQAAQSVQENRDAAESYGTDEGSAATPSHAAEERQKEPEIQKAQEAQPVPGDPMELERLLKTEEEEENSSDRIWDQLRREHTKILDFDYEKGCEILTIKPQDIGLLPRETWVYGNNSFLLHGYYNYRYLILAKLFNPEGTPRYLLGVPGHYYSNERYMASMFGFPNFVLSKNQPMEDGRFGYWYTDVKIGN